MRAALLSVLLACLAAAAFTFQIRHEMADFEVYRMAGARAVAGEPLYQAADEHYQFKYFPASAFVFVPFAAIPMGAAKAIWFGLSVGILVAFAALSLRQLPTRLVSSPLIVIATILTLGKFYAHELTLGQTNLLLGLVVVAALGLLARRDDIGAGAFFGAAALVKPYGLLFLPYLVATKRFRAAAACGCVLVFALALPTISYGIQGNLDLLVAWWDTVSSSTPANLTNQDNVSIAAMYAKWLGPGPAAERLTMATSLVLLAVCGVAIARGRTSANPEFLEVALLLTAVVLLSPQGWDYVLLLSTPAIMLIVNALPRFGRPMQALTAACLATIGLTIYDVMGRAAYTRFMALSIITLAYGGVIGVMVYLRAKRMY